MATSPHARPRAEATKPEARGWTPYLGVFKFSARAMRLVWSTSRALTIGFAIGTVIAGLVPGGIAYVGKRLIDSVLVASHGGDRDQVMMWVAVEMGLVVGMAAITRILGIFRSLLRARLGNRVNVMILEKALELELAHF